jgi:hypothetical protein
MQDGEQVSGSSIFANRRAMSSMTALIVLIVVVIIAGAGAYGGLSSVPTSTTTKKTCAPASACQATTATNDVTLFIPYTVAYGQQYSQIAVGTSVQASVAVTGTETIKTFAVQWGPGQVTTGSTGSLSYTYGTPGLYTLIANATDTSGVLHSGPGQLGSVLVNPTSASITLGHFPTLATTLTNTTGGYYGWIGAGERHQLLKHPMDSQRTHAPGPVGYHAHQVLLWCELCERDVRVREPRLLRDYSRGRLAQLHSERLPELHLGCLRGVLRRGAGMRHL